MAGIKLDIVTAERAVYSEEVERVIAPGIDGQLGILPHHAPLMTTLQAGELLVKKEGEEISLVISGGFLEVRPDHVVVLADTAERVEEIDISRAEEAKRRAEERLAQGRASGFDSSRSEASLRRALVRLTVADKVKRKRRPGK